MVKIIDTSYHKGYIDWNKVKATGVEGVILKATDGFFMPVDMEQTAWAGHTDPSFLLYWKKLKGLFSWRAAYHFLRVDDEVAIQRKRPTSLEQIHLFYDVVKKEGLEWDDYIVLDIEQNISQIDYLDRAVIAKRVQDVIALTEELFGRKPIIYTGGWYWEFFNKHLDTDFIRQYYFWLAHYWAIDKENELTYNGSYYYERPWRLFPKEWRGEDNLNKRIAYCKLPIINNVPTVDPDKVLMWQYSSSGKINGIGSSVDINLELVPEELWKEARGEEPVVEPPEPPVEPPEPPTDCEGILNTILDALNALIALIRSFFKK